MEIYSIRECVIEFWSAILENFMDSVVCIFYVRDRYHNPWDYFILLKNWNIARDEYTLSYSCRMV